MDLSEREGPLLRGLDGSTHLIRVRVRRIDAMRTAHIEVKLKDALERRKRGWEGARSKS